MMKFVSYNIYFGNLSFFLVSIIKARHTVRIWFLVRLVFYTSVIECIDLL